MQKVINPVFIVSFLMLLSCNVPDKGTEKKPSLKDEPDQSVALQSTNPAQQPIPVGPVTAATDSIGSGTVTKQAGNPQWDRKIIKSGTLKLEVKDHRKTNELVHQAVKKFGGYVAQEEQTVTDASTGTVMTIKVPVMLFEDMLNEISATGVKVIERKISSEDVSTTFVDTRSRLEAKKQMRLKYLEFLKQSKNMEEVLQVQQEINSIQEEMEAATGRLGYLANQSSFSTIVLTFYQPLEGLAVPDPSPSFYTRVGEAFSSGARGLGELLVGLATIWPLLLVIGLLIVIIKRKKTSNQVKQQVS